MSFVKQMRNKNFPFFGSAFTHALRNTVHNGVRYPLSLVISKYRDKMNNRTLQRLVIKALTNAFIGVFTSLIAARIAYPLHVITTRQKQINATALNIIRHIYRTEGLSGFSKGFWEIKVLILCLDGAMVNIGTPIFNKAFDKMSNLDLSKIIKAFRKRKTA